MICACTAGCSAPARTFVSEAAPKQSRRAADVEPASSILEHPTLEPGESQGEANSKESSVWSKWIGAFNPAKPKPAPRIPLPRTDRETKGAGKDFPPGDAEEFSDF
jgi:hypothetical protein